MEKTLWLRDPARQIRFNGVSCDAVNLRIHFAFDMGKMPPAATVTLIRSGLIVREKVLEGPRAFLLHEAIVDAIRDEVL